jgi:hypothetical protein
MLLERVLATCAWRDDVCMMVRIMDHMRWSRRASTLLSHVSSHFVHRVRNNRTVYAFAFLVVIRSSCFIYAKVENRLYKLQHRSSSLRDWFALGPHAVRVQRAQLLREQFV